MTARVLPAVTAPWFSAVWYLWMLWVIVAPHTSADTAVISLSVIVLEYEGGYLETNFSRTPASERLQ